MANLNVKKPFKVIFLDFDGVLNSAASFLWEKRKKTVRISDTLSPICCSNFQMILERDSDIKIVISSTWRKLHTMQELKNILNSYGVDPSRVIDFTPAVFSGDRGHEIKLWLEDHPNVEQYVILDDDPTAINGLNKYDEKTDTVVKNEKGHFFQTTWDDGLSFSVALKVLKIFRPDLFKPVKPSDLTPFII